MKQVILDDGDITRATVVSDILCFVWEDGLVSHAGPYEPSIEKKTNYLHDWLMGCEGTHGNQEPEHH